MSVQPKIKLVIKRSETGKKTASAYSIPGSSYPTPPPERYENGVPRAEYCFELPHEPTLEHAQELLQHYGRGPAPLQYDAQKQEVVRESPVAAVHKSKGRRGKPVTSLGRFPVSRSASESAAINRMKANRDAARVAVYRSESSNDNVFQPVAMEGISAVREVVLLKEYELCLAADVANKAQAFEKLKRPGHTVGKAKTVMNAPPTRKTPTRKARAIPAGSIEPGSKRRKK